MKTTYFGQEARLLGLQLIVKNILFLKTLSYY